MLDHAETWAQALSIQSQPRNVPRALRQLAEVTDDIWHAAGDKSADYNWYTKRGLLASVYTATELYMLTDYSPGFADTWEVLDRRLSDVASLGKVMGQVSTPHLHRLLTVPNAGQSCQCNIYTTRLYCASVHLPALLAVMLFSGTSKD